MSAVPSLPYDPRPRPRGLTREARLSNGPPVRQVAPAAAKAGLAGFVIRRVMEHQSPGVGADGTPLEQAIARSEELLDLPDNWDNESASRPDRHAWERAVAYLRQIERTSVGLLDVTLPAPRITPGPAGSIDVFWRHRGTRILLNFPVGDAAPNFFGRDDRGTDIRGTLAPDSDAGLLPWLAR